MRSLSLAWALLRTFPYHDTLRSVAFFPIKYPSTSSKSFHWSQLSLRAAFTMNSRLLKYTHPLSSMPVPITKLAPSHACMMSIGLHAVQPEFKTNTFAPWRCCITHYSYPNARDSNSIESITPSSSSSSPSSPSSLHHFEKANH